MSNIPETNEVKPTSAGPSAIPELHPDIKDAGIEAVHEALDVQRTIGRAQENNVPVFLTGAATPATTDPHPIIAQELQRKIEDTNAWLSKRSKLDEERSMKDAA